MGFWVLGLTKRVPRYMMASTPHDWRYPEPAAAATMKPLVKARFLAGELKFMFLSALLYRVLLEFVSRCKKGSRA